MPYYLSSLCLAVAFLVLLSYIRAALGKGVRTLPGPFWARFSGLYRLSLVYKGNGPEQYRKLHKRYGSIVRVGPNHVSISDVAMIPVIYGIGSKFTKVRYVILKIIFSKNTDTFLHYYGPNISGQGHG
jgi:hypothetical protein